MGEADHQKPRPSENGEAGRPADDRSAPVPGSDDTVTVGAGQSSIQDPDATLLQDSPLQWIEPGAPAFPIPDWDRFVPLRFLGQGGMGSVFLATDRQLSRRVALKFVRSDRPHHTARLLVEARAQARVNHDRVCKVFEVGEAHGQVYISMQYIEGQPLSSAAKGLTFEQRALIIRDAAEGVHEVHRSGIIHRDLKPGNIMVERDGDWIGDGHAAIHGPGTGPWGGRPS